MMEPYTLLDLTFRGLPIVVNMEHLRPGERTDGHLDLAQVRHVFEAQHWFMTEVFTKDEERFNPPRYAVVCNCDNHNFACITAFEAHRSFVITGMSIGVMRTRRYWGELTF